MEKKTRLKRNLESLSTQFVDVTLNSPNFFNISYLPETFTSGKNLVKLKGTRPHFIEDSEIQVEILDSNKDPIYYGVLTGLDDDAALSIAVYIYDTTPPGPCTITFVGTSTVDLDLNPIPKDTLS